MTTVGVKPDGLRDVAGKLHNGAVADVHAAVQKLGDMLPAGGAAAAFGPTLGPALTSFVSDFAAGKRGLLPAVRDALGQTADAIHNGAGAYEHTDGSSAHGIRQVGAGS